MNKVYTYTIKYIDTHSNGQWNETQHISTTPKSRKEIIDFFGLLEPDVIAYKINLEVSE